MKKPKTPEDACKSDDKDMMVMHNTPSPTPKVSKGSTKTPYSRGLHLGPHEQKRIRDTMVEGDQGMMVTGVVDATKTDMTAKEEETTGNTRVNTISIYSGIPLKRTPSKADSSIRRTVLLGTDGF